MNNTKFCFIIYENKKKPTLFLIRYRTLTFDVQNYLKQHFLLVFQYRNRENYKWQFIVDTLNEIFLQELWAVDKTIQSLCV